MMVQAAHAAAAPVACWGLTSGAVQTSVHGTTHFRARLSGLELDLDLLDAVAATSLGDNGEDNGETEGHDGRGRWPGVM